VLANEQEVRGCEVVKAEEDSGSVNAARELSVKLAAAILRRI